MAVNNAFYATINELVTRASSGTVTNVVDYTTFIDAGKTISQIQGSDLQNNFISALMNKIALSVNTARSYTGLYKDLVRGSIEFGNTIEMIVNLFYDTQAAPFVSLTDGVSVDQYTVHKPKVDVNYFVDTNAYQIPITIQYDQVMKAWESPAAMDAFINGTIQYVMNSNEQARESGRISLVASLIVDLTAETSATSDNTPGVRYDLVTLYNAMAGTALTASNCLYNEEFVKFAVATIRKVMKKTERASTSYNLENIKTFTPEYARHLFVNSQLTSAMDTYIFTNNYRPEASMLTDYIEVPYWQNENTPLVVKAKATPDAETETDSPAVIAVFCDQNAIGEYLKKERMTTSPFNAKGEYWNNFLNVETRYVKNKFANTVMFTLA